MIACAFIQIVDHSSFPILSFLISSIQPHSDLLACSRRFGAVPWPVTFPFSISAAHSAAPTVFVKAKRIDAIGTSSSSTVATPKLERISMTSDTHSRESRTWHKPSICGLVLFNMLLPLSAIPLFQLEVPRVCCRSRPSALENDKNHSADNGYKVQRQVHEVSNQGCGRELGKRFLDQLPKLCDRITSSLDLSPARDKICGVLRD